MANLNREWLPRMRIGCVLALAAMLSACGGGGGSPSGSPGGNPPPGTPTNVTVSGKITFDRIPFEATRGNGLDPNAVSELPARGVVVEAVSAGSVIASAVTNTTGDYSLSVPANTQVFIRARAQMRKTGAAPTWDFRVLNNTNDRLYALDGSEFNSGSSNVTRSLRAPTGWSGSAYGQERPAAPFAILDTIYQSVELILSAQSAAEFEPLDVFWSRENRPTLSQDFCIADGQIGTTFYTSGGGDSTECTGSIAAGIYVLGNFAAGDTDEFDQHVMAHEFGHYVEDQFARSDSIGGSHAYGDKLDLRVAFGEGWGNAFAGMVLNDPVYRDSYSGMTLDSGFSLEADDPLVEGWYSEDSVSEILWDAFDAANEPGDTVALGFGPIFTALMQQADTPALTSIFSFARALKQATPGQASGINALLAGEGIANTDEFGTAEANNGGDVAALPIYRVLPLNGGQQLVCVTPANGEYNKLGNNRFFRLDLSTSALVTFNVTGIASGSGTAAIDPDIYVFRNGAEVGSGTSGAVSTETISQIQLQAGTHVIEVYDYDLEASDSMPRCMTVSATGT